MGPIALNPAARIGINVLLLLAGVVALRLAESVIVPMLVALILGTVLGPAATWLHERLKVRWSLACMTVVIGLILTSVLISVIFSSSVVRLVSELSNERQFLETYKKFRDKLEQVSPVAIDPTLFPKDEKDDPVTVEKIGSLRYLVDAAPYIAREVAKYSMNWSWQLVVILFITFFVLLEGKMLARRAVAIFGPSDEVQAKATAVLFEMANQVRTYLVWRTLINLVLAIVMFIVYQSCGLRQALTWAVLLAILNYIPYFGPVLASIPPFLDGFIFASPAAAVVVTVLFWVIVVLEGYLVVPLVMGRSMDLNATTVMLACLFWELVWGTTGLFLAMPIMAGVKAILYNVPDLRVWANLMSTHEDPPDPPTAAPAPAGLAGAADSANGKPGAAHVDGVRSTEQAQG